MSALIFFILLVVYVGNVLYFPLVTAYDQLWVRFICRGEPTEYANKWQNYKWQHFDIPFARTLPDQWFYWFVNDLVIGLALVIFAMFLGAANVLAWVVLGPLALVTCLYGLRYLRDTCK